MILLSPAAPKLGAFALTGPVAFKSQAPTLSWSASTNATSYDVKIGSDAACASVLWEQDSATGTSVQVTGSPLPNYNRYYACVTASDSGATLPASNDGRAFFVGDLVLPYTGPTKLA